MIQMNTLQSPLPNYSNDIDKVNLVRCNTSDNGIKDESLHNLSARVQKLMNSTRVTEDNVEEGATEVPQNPEEE